MIADLTFITLFGVACIFMLAAAFTSFMEKEIRAGLLFFLIGFVLSLSFSAVILFLPDNTSIRWLSVISCPYNHPHNWLNRFIRFSILNNLLFQNVARKLDDVFYGRYPVKKNTGNNDL